MEVSPNDSGYDLFASANNGSQKHASSEDLLISIQQSKDDYLIANEAVSDHKESRNSSTSIDTSQAFEKLSRHNSGWGELEVNDYYMAA